MKKISPIFSTAVVLAALYMAFSFAHADINFTRWHSDSRAACAGLMFVTVVGCLLYTIMENDDEKPKDN